MPIMGTIRPTPKKKPGVSEVKDGELFRRRCKQCKKETEKTRKLTQTGLRKCTQKIVERKTIAAANHKERNQK